ncbi:MAG: carboxypeptidase-like regulatory domain-containing protein, partial [Dysgonomonas sp.]
MKRILAISLFLWSVASIYAQSFTLRGTVLDTEGEPYIGVSVILKGTTLGTTTDVDGKFVLNIPDLKKNNVVEFRYIGTEPQEIKIDGSKNDLKIVLVEDRHALDEVVVVGYEVMKKKDMTAASMSISADYASEGKVSGVMISEAEFADDIAAGTLTAGELSDFAKWNQWDKILTEDFSSYLEKWQIRPQKRYMVQLTN